MTTDTRSVRIAVASPKRLSQPFRNLLKLLVQRVMSTPALSAQYQRIQDVLDRNGNRCSPEEFRQIVNVVFHRYESAQYDEIHRCMWQSLPVIFDLLSRAALPTL